MTCRVLIVGGSRGIGAEVARQLAGRGDHVVVVGRQVSAMQELVEAAESFLGRIHTLVHDVTQRDEVEVAFQHAVDVLGGLDILVYSAGVLPHVDIDQFETSVDAHVIAVNLVGAMAWCNLAARKMKAAGTGVIAGIGSVAGERGRMGNPAYCASKAGLHSYLESLRNRLDRHGVRVITIKPGPVRTDMVEGRGALPLMIDVDVAARAIVSSLSGGPQVRYTPWLWGPLMATVRGVPSFVFRRLNV